MPDGEAEAAPASRSTAAEARRRRILDKGQERLKHITFGGSSGGEAPTSSGGSSVSRSLNFGDDAVNDSGDFIKGGSLTPAASGEGVEAQGAALRSKSWLALRDSPAKSPGKTPPKSSRSPTNFQEAASPSSPAGVATPSAMQRATSAKLLPVSSPAPGYESDDEALISPTGTGSPQASSVTHVSRGAWSPASPSPLPLPNSGNAAMSPARTAKWAEYDSPAKAVLAARRPKTATSHRGLFSTALAWTALLRTALAALLAVLSAGGLQHAVTFWLRHAYPSWTAHIKWLSLYLPWQRLAAFPPVAALLLLEVAVIAAAYLLLCLRPAATVDSQPSEGGSAGWASLVLSSAAPRLHHVFSVVVPLHRQLWQDVAVYVFTVAALTIIGSELHESCWQWLHSLGMSERTLSSWQLAASRWAL